MTTFTFQTQFSVMILASSRGISSLESLSKTANRLLKLYEDRLPFCRTFQHRMGHQSCLKWAHSSLVKYSEQPTIKHCVDSVKAMGTHSEDCFLASSNNPVTFFPMLQGPMGPHMVGLPFDKTPLRLNLILPAIMASFFVIRVLFQEGIVPAINSDFSCLSTHLISLPASTCLYC